jgi:AcrR family transcriptional regulator
MRERAKARADDILDVVVDLLEAEGYGAVQVRVVASRARASLATIYKLFGTRDQLIASAVQRWMERHAFSELAMPGPEESPYEILVRVLRAVFEPWERHPRMLEAHYRLRAGSSGEWLKSQGKEIVAPLTATALKDADPDYVSDLKLIYCHLHRGVMARFADGEIAVTEILPILEQALRRLVADNPAVISRSGQRTVPGSESAKRQPRRPSPVRRQHPRSNSTLGHSAGPKAGGDSVESGGAAGAYLMTQGKWSHSRQSAVSAVGVLDWPF